MIILLMFQKTCIFWCTISPLRPYGIQKMNVYECNGVEYVIVLFNKVKLS